MRRIAKKEGGPTDTSRDHEMTDWTQVRDVAEELVRVMERPARQAAAV